MDGSMNVCMHARQLALWGHTKQITVISTAVFHTPESCHVLGVENNIGDEVS